MRAMAMGFIYFLGLTVGASAQQPSFLPGYWFHAGGPSELTTSERTIAGKKVPRSFGPNRIALYAFYQPSSVNISKFAARLEKAYRGRSFHVAIYANGADNLPVGLPVAQTANAIGASHPPNRGKGGTVTGEVLGGDYRLIAGPATYWAAVMPSDGAIMAFEGRAASSTYSAYLVGAADPRDIFGSGNVGSFSLLAPYAVYGIWPDLTDFAIGSEFETDGTGRNAAVAYMVHSIPAN